jgi:hypothetical protein
VHAASAPSSYVKDERVLSVVKSVTRIVRYCLSANLGRKYLDSKVLRSILKVFSACMDSLELVAMTRKGKFSESICFED